MPAAWKAALPARGFYDPLPPGEGRGEGIKQVYASHLEIYHYPLVQGADTLPNPKQRRASALSGCLKT